MVFSSSIFIFFFLPVVLSGYFLLRSVKARNVWLFMVSLLFYFWGGYTFFPVILYSIALNYTGGRVLGVLQAENHKKVRKAAFIIIVVLNLLSLGYWKYTKFLVQIANDITGSQFAIPDIVLPIGISFFTFQGMSYVIDVYRGEAEVQKNILKTGLYIALFPQLIAGPIVRYTEIERQLNARIHSVDQFMDGLRIFAVGLAKKAILSNSLAVTADTIFGNRPCQNGPAVAWLGVITYSLQLYFDFSGYSDMAVGLGKIFGFQFPRNFDYPYISCSVAELWRRWHISLSTWFRDYVYIPIGGSRRGSVYLNLLCVFLLTGLWHGASWNYVVWGLYWGILIVAERYLSGRHPEKEGLPKAFAWLGMMFLWLISMVIFKTATLRECGMYLRSLFGMLKQEDVGFTLAYYLQIYDVFIMILSVIAMVPAGKWCYERLKEKMPAISFLILENILTLFLLAVSFMYVVTETYNPFIYFQF